MKEQRSARGLSRQGLDAAFETQEARKSALILEARLLREQQEDQAAAARFAEAATIEESLAELCAEKGLGEKALAHQFSAASCWAQAGDLYHAILRCEDLLARTDLPDRLRQRVREYADTLRARRAEWYAGRALEATVGEG